MRTGSNFVQGCQTAVDLIVLNLVHLLCCLPIFTIGAAMAALNSCTIKMVRDEETTPIYREYFKAFKSNFRKSTAMWLIMLLILAFMVLDFMISRAVDSDATRSFLFGLLIVVAIVWACMVSYLFPLTAFFENTKMNHIRNSLRLAFGKLQYTFPIVVLNLTPLLIIFVPGDYIKWMILADIVIWFSGVAFINARMFNALFNELIKNQSKGQ